MAGKAVNGSGKGARSGAQTLFLFGAPLNAFLLRALAKGPKRHVELQQAADYPAQTTLRAQLKRLVELGAVEKRRRDRFPGVLEYELTSAGDELIFVADVLDRWLAVAPAGALALGDNAAKSAIRALAEAWSTTILRVLSASALALTELDGVIASLSYPSLERRLTAMRLAGLVEARPGNGRGTPYGVSEWARRGVAPLLAASRWERRHGPPSTLPLARLDVETGFLLLAPLLRPSEDTVGSCRLAAEFSRGDERRLAGVRMEVADGRVASCVTNLKPATSAWALGSPTSWLSALIEGDVDGLELGGDTRLAVELVGLLHRVLFEASLSKSP